jgi:hypothetical protein
MAMDLPVRWTGGLGTIQPFAKPWSMMAHSILLIATGGSLIPKVHAFSQG